MLDGLDLLRIQSNVGYWASQVKYLTLGMSPNDDNGSSLPVFEEWSRLFCYTNVARTVVFRKSKK